MQPLDRSIMSDFLNQAQDVLSKMTAQSDKMSGLTELHEKQLCMYKETIDRALEGNEKRWTSLRNTVWSVIILVLGSFVGGGFIIDEKVDVDELEKMDLANKTDVVRGDQSVINSVYDTFEEETEMDHTKSKIAEEEAKVDSYKEVTGYQSRSIKK